MQHERSFSKKKRGALFILHYALLGDSMKNCQIFSLSKKKDVCKGFVKLHKFCQKMSKNREGGKISYPHEKYLILP